MATKKKNPPRDNGSQASPERKSARSAKASGKNEAAAKQTAAPATERKPGKLPTGSLHAQPREPEGAEELKRKLTEVTNASQKLKRLRASVPKNFYQIGEILQQVRDHELHQVKGYASVEDYAEREAGLSPQASATSLRIFETFLPATAERISFQKLSAAIRAMDETPDLARSSKAPSRARSPIPPHKL